MPITRSMFPALIQAASKEGSEAYGQGYEGALKKYLQKNQPSIAGQEQSAKNEANLKTMEDPRLQALLNEGGSAGVGDIRAGGNPNAKMAAQGPHQAGAFLKTAQAAYKPINDQLDASKATLDNLNMGNSTGDKLALINEAKLSLAGSGGRAIGQMVAHLSGDPTMASDLQKASNWIQNTPNIPTLQPAQRDAIRESVFGRLNQVEQQHQQAKTALAQQGPIIAPQVDTSSLVNSITTPTEAKLNDVKKLQAEYAAQRAGMQAQGNPQVSSPSQASANPTTLDKLRGLFSKAPQAQAQVPQPDHSAAAAWAKANPKDPRAQAILQMQSQMGAGGQ